MVLANTILETINANYAPKIAHSVRILQDSAISVSTTFKWTQPSIVHVTQDNTEMVLQY